MSKEKLHIDDHFIPEGLEFREEYMHAALNKYKRTKRVIAFKRSVFVLSAILFMVGGSIALLDRPSAEKAELQDNLPVEKNADSPELKSGNQQSVSTQETSSSIDLVKGEEGLHKNGQGPAVESSESTQDRSAKAVDKGDSMSSGVGLPGQLSISKRKLQQKSASAPPKTDADNLSSTAVFLHENTRERDMQTVTENPAPSESTPSTSSEQMRSDLERIQNRTAFLSAERAMRPYGKTITPLPSSPWTLYAALGMRAWSDYGFNRSPFKADGNFNLGIAYRWNRKLSSEVSGSFFTVTGIATPYTVVQRSYGAGFSETTYRYFTERLYQLGASIVSKYHLTGRHTVGMGWKTDYLLTADNRIETGSATSFENLGTTGVSAKGYVQGFRTVQHAIVFNYEYALGKSKSLGAHYQLGLTDFTKNNFFGTSMDRNSMLSIYFRIKLNR